jgi:hypothetical protein
VIKQLFSFDRLITPVIIRYLCYVMTAIWGLVAVIGVLGGLARLFSDFLAGVGVILASIVVPGVLILLNRVGAELALVIFMIRDELAWQRERQSGPGMARPPAGFPSGPPTNP